ncbi:MAG TPA: DUF2089 domain-containing protein [Polyangiaceae bacterium]
MKSQPQETLHPAPRQCPVCSGELHVARLQCDQCQTGLEGKFSLGRFAKLSRDQIAFVEAFLACRGKIKDVEQLLGVSYPTVVARLDDVVSAMGFESGESGKSPEHAAARKEILEDVASGKLNAAEAAARIRALKKNGGR